MREALAARSGRDFVTAAPRRSAAASGAGILRACLLPLARHPWRLLGAGALGAAACAVAINALAWQTARHPSPLFGTKAVGAALPRVAPATPPLPAPTALAPRPPARPAEPLALPSASPLALPVPAPPPRRDPIGDLIRTAEAPGSTSPKGDPQKALTQAQRALTRLGYGPLKVDGVMGQGTKQAIERFERDQKLPVTGELNARTARELSSRGGAD